MLLVLLLLLLMLLLVFLLLLLLPLQMGSLAPFCNGSWVNLFVSREVQ